MVSGLANERTCSPYVSCTLQAMSLEGWCSWRFHSSSFPKNWEIELLRLPTASLKWSLGGSSALTLLFEPSSSLMPPQLLSLRRLPSLGCRKQWRGWRSCAVLVLLDRDVRFASASGARYSWLIAALPYVVPLVELAALCLGSQASLIQSRFWPSSPPHRRWRPGRYASDPPVGSWSGSIDSHSFSRRKPPGSASSPLTNFFFFWLPFFHPIPCHRQTLSWSS